MVYHALPKKHFRGGVKCLLYHALQKPTFQGGREMSVITRPPVFFFNLGVEGMELKAEGGIVKGGGDGGVREGGKERVREEVVKG